jgi:hypothetical protein
MTDDTDAFEQVAAAVEESDLTDGDVEELRALLGKLEDEITVPPCVSHLSLRPG